MKASVKDFIEDFSALEITEDDISGYREFEPANAAKIYDTRVRAIDVAQKRTFVELGLIMIEMEDRELYRHIADPEGQPYRSFGRWLVSAAPVARSTCYAAMGAMRAIQEEISTDDLREMSRRNVKVLSEISSHVRQLPEIIEAAKTLEENDFRAKLETDHPDQHVGKKKALTVRPLADVTAFVEQVFKMAEYAYGVEGREQALEAIALYFADGPSEREDCEGKSNRIAFETRKK